MSVVVPTETSVAPAGSPPLSQPLAAAAIRGTRPGGRLAVLDGLRLFAALMVVGFHYTSVAPEVWGVPFTARMFPRLHYVTAYGRLGVELFFLISGFVICMSAWGRSLGGFVASRVSRLYPAYWLAVLVTALVINAVGPWRKETFSFSAIMANLTMLEAPVGVHMVDWVYWTLWIELHFYLLFAIVVWRGLTYRRVVLFCALWITAAVLLPGNEPPNPAFPQPPLEALIDPAHAPFFVAGVVLYLMYRFRPNLLLWGMLGVCYALGLNQMEPLSKEYALATSQALRPGPAMVILTAIFAVMTAVALGWLNWLRGKWLTVAGAMSYPLYLLHDCLGYTVIYHFHGRVSKWVIVIGLVVGMLVFAWLVHRFVERPLGPRLKRGLTAALDQVSTAADHRLRRSG